MASTSSYEVYIPNNERWKRHFEYMANSNAKRHKDFYVVRGGQTGSGPSPVVMVSPVQADVERAKGEIKQDIKENINGNMPDVAQLPSDRRRNNIKKAARRKSLKRKKSTKKAKK